MEWEKSVVLPERSEAITLAGIDFNAIPGLEAVSNELVGTGVTETWQRENRFDYHWYQAHITGVLEVEPVNFRKIPALIDNLQRDLIWWFIALVLLRHEGKVVTQQTELLKTTIILTSS